MLQVYPYIILAVVLFIIGVVGFLARRNLIVMFMCVELMLNAVNLLFVAFSRMNGGLDGQAAVFFIMVIAAAEAAVGLGIIIALFRSAKSVQSSDASELSW